MKWESLCLNWCLLFVFQYIEWLSLWLVCLVTFTSIHTHTFIFKTFLRMPLNNIKSNFISSSIFVCYVFVLLQRPGSMWSVHIASHHIAYPPIQWQNVQWLCDCCFFAFAFAFAGSFSAITVFSPFILENLLTLSSGSTMDVRWDITISNMQSTLPTIYNIYV